MKFFSFQSQNLKQDILKIIAATLFLFGLMFTVGGFLLLQSFTGWLSLIVAVISGFWLRRLNKQSKNHLELEDPERSVTNTSL